MDKELRRRARVLHYIGRHPGRNLAQLGRGLQVPNARAHAEALAQAGLVSLERHRGRRGNRLTSMVEATTLVEVGRIVEAYWPGRRVNHLAILSALEGKLGLTVADLAATIGLAVAAVRREVAYLECQGKVRIEVRQRRKLVGLPNVELPAIILDSTMWSLLDVVNHQSGIEFPDLFQYQGIHGASPASIRHRLRILAEWGFVRTSSKDGHTRYQAGPYYPDADQRRSRPHQSPRTRHRMQRLARHWGLLLPHMRPRKTPRV